MQCLLRFVATSTDSWLAHCEREVLYHGGALSPRGGQQPPQSPRLLTSAPERERSPDKAGTPRRSVSPPAGVWPPPPPLAAAHKEPPAAAAAAAPPAPSHVALALPPLLAKPNGVGGLAATPNGHAASLLVTPRFSSLRAVAQASDPNAAPYCSTCAFAATETASLRSQLVRPA